MSGRVIVVGSVNVDLVVTAVRLPGPGQTVTGGTFARHPGGKGGNQAVAAARLGRATFLIGAVGDDAFGAEARGALAAEGVDVSGLVSVLGQPTGVALILVDATGENLISVASGANAMVDPAIVGAALDRLGELEGDVVLVNREIPTAAVEAALAAARRAGATTILNPAPADGISAAELEAVDILTPNRGEVAACAGGSGNETIEALARRLVASGVARAVVVTLGRDGALLVPADGAFIHVEGHTIRAIDSTGAGDTFSGALAVGIAEGRPIEEAVRRANVAAALSTTVPGARTGMPTLQTLKNAVEAALG
jgi:ribokinase